MNLNNLEPGMMVVYWSGPSIAKSNCPEKYAAWELYMKGEADLFQVRQSPGVFSYIIRKRLRPENQRVLEKRAYYYRNLADRNMKMRSTAKASAVNEAKNGENNET